MLRDYDTTSAMMDRRYGKGANMDVLRLSKGDIDESEGHAQQVLVRNTSPLGSQGKAGEARVQTAES